ncbi:SAM-dependent methyltransferase [Streptomyces albidoflavus]
MPGVRDGVGRTALMVAAARAIETHRPDALARDPYAEHFVRAAPAAEGWPLRPEEVPGGETDPLWGRLGRYFGLRTRVLDDFVTRSALAGARQTVLLGAGLDTRAYRLQWPGGHVVFEIDTPEVLEFKDRVLERAGAVARAKRVPLAADLREEWAGPLVATGFDPALSTVWLAEGLLLYLPGAAERRLIATAARLTGASGALAFEAKVIREPEKVRGNPVYTAARERIGVDLLRLFDPEPRPDSAADLASLGWSTTTRTPFDFSALHGRGPRPEADDALAANRWVFAARPGPPLVEAPA